MSDRLAQSRERFRARFLEVARARLVKSRALAAAAQPGLLAAELHNLAGEAGVCGVPEVSTSAFAAERQAQRWHAGEADARAACEAALDATALALAQVS